MKTFLRLPYHASEHNSNSQFCLKVCSRLFTSDRRPGESVDAGGAPERCTAVGVEDEVDGVEAQSFAARLEEVEGLGVELGEVVADELGSEALLQVPVVVDKHEHDEGEGEVVGERVLLVEGLQTLLEDREASTGGETRGGGDEDDNVIMSLDVVAEEVSQVQDDGLLDGELAKLAANNALR